jgi:hypothetical protein
MILHELAHGFHDREFGYDEPRILAAYRKAQESGRYEKVLRYTGKTERHYALNNQMEYFAEATEAYFGVNDFYPFVHAELRQFDPVGYDLLREIWGECKGQKQAGTSPRRSGRNYRRSRAVGRAGTARTCSGLLCALPTSRGDINWKPS